MVWRPVDRVGRTPRDLGQQHQPIRGRVGGGRLISEYVAEFIPGTTLERAALVVEELNVGSITPSDLHSPPGFRVVSSRRSGVEVVADINSLFAHPEVEKVYPILAWGCPSGGGGGGGPGGPADIPTLDPKAALLLILLLAGAAVVLVRHRP